MFLYENNVGKEFDNEGMLQFCCAEFKIIFYNYFYSFKVTAWNSFKNFVFQKDIICSQIKLYLYFIVFQIIILLVKMYF
jgi:hypothetical protein